MKPRVLVVDDQADVCHLIAAGLERAYSYAGAVNLRQKVDFIEVLQFCGGFTTEVMRTQSYYHFLDLGFDEGFTQELCSASGDYTPDFH